MKSKLLCLDLAICAVWMLSMLGHGYYSGVVGLAFLVMRVALRLTISFTLARKELRSWMPLGLFAVLMLPVFIFGQYNGVDVIVTRLFALFQQKENDVLTGLLEWGLIAWLFLLPYVWYLCLLCRKQLVRTDLSIKDLLGGILWHDRQTRICSATLAILLFSLLTGLGMVGRQCMMVCMVASPLTYWLSCRHYRIKAEQVWLLVLAMVLFWYGQWQTGAWRIGLLAISLALAIYIGTRFYGKVRNIALASVLVVYLGILLPSISIGYNQYACIDYVRCGLPPGHYSGIMYVADGTHRLYGLRDRYGLLVKPEYDYPKGVAGEYPWRVICHLQKNGGDYYYDLYNNEFVGETDYLEAREFKIK